MTVKKATYLCGALVLAQAGIASADTTLEERIIVLEERMDGVKSGNTQIDFGGFIKADTMLSKYSDGDLAGGSVGRDFMVPSTIPYCLSS